MGVVMGSEVVLVGQEMVYADFYAMVIPLLASVEYVLPHMLNIMNLG